MIFWKRAGLAAGIGVAYIAIVRPLRAVLMPAVMQSINPAAIEALGYAIGSTSPVNRMFTTPAGAILEFKAPFDSFFHLALIFAALYGVPGRWLATVALAHATLWLVQFLLLMTTSTGFDTLPAVDFLSRYLNPVITLSVIPLWIIRSKSQAPVSHE